MKQRFSREHAQFIKKEKKKNILVHMAQIGFLVLFLVLWEILTAAGWLDDFIFSSPSRIINTTSELIGSGNLFVHIWTSFYETVLGFILGTVIGTLIAIIMWRFSWIKKVFEPYLVALNSLPKIALGPIIIIWVGTGAPGIITMAVLISFVITALNMLGGFLATDPDKLLLMSAMRANKFQTFTKLVFPASIPVLMNTLKINVGMSWVGTIMGEYLNSKEGLGYLIVYGSQVFKLDLVMTCTVILCLLAGGMYAVVALIAHAVTAEK